MQPNVFAKFLLFTADRQNFIKVVAPAFGVPFCAVILWMFGRYGGVGWWLLLTLVSLGAGWLYAYLMWYFVQEEIRRVVAKLSTRALDDSHTR